MMTRTQQAGGGANQRGLPAPSWPQPGGFTLFELLTVIGILVILVAILVPTLGRVKIKAQTTQTLAIMSNLASDIESYYQRFHAYPGPVPAAQLPTSPYYTTASGTNKISGTQNMLLGLTYPMGTTSTPPTLWTSLPKDSNGNYLASGPVDYASMTPAGTFEQLPPYFSPTKQVGKASGATANSLPANFPVVFDAYADALPILYFRRTPGANTPVASQNPSAGTAAYYVDENAEYLNAQLVAPDGANVYQGSYTSASNGKASFGIPELAFATTGTGTPTYTGTATYTGTLPAAARGGFMLISAGPDRYYGSYAKKGSTTWKDDDLVQVGGE